ncbi:MAG: AAA family ATPase [Lachnospiraceae bacterium]|nr:AAA family ATPase [Lachnospiraceae bacterium]
MSKNAFWRFCAYYDKSSDSRFLFEDLQEWDAPLWEFKEDTTLQKDYILFLRSLFKNKDVIPKAIAAAYMTGILPVKKYGTESVLSDFKEYAMVSPAKLAGYVGFTEQEVQKLCEKFHMDFKAVYVIFIEKVSDEVRRVYGYADRAAYEGL